MLAFQRYDQLFNIMVYSHFMDKIKNDGHFKDLSPIYNKHTWN